MSQLKVYGPGERDPLNKPIKNLDDLVEIFHAAERKPQDRLIGIEYELFGQVNYSSSPILYTGDPSIVNLFLYLEKKTAHAPNPYICIYENAYPVAMQSKFATIALEPGGQIEIAAFPQKDLERAAATLYETVADIKVAAEELGVSLFALGIHPLARRQDMAVVQKTRYDIMRAYMGQKNGLGLDMMTRSCAIQINLDYQDEKDMAKKGFLAAALVPFYSLLCASVAFIEGKPVSRAIERGHVWRNTDRERTGIPAVLLSKDFSYQSWINMVLDVPMYFFRRGNDYHSVPGASFREFVAHGLNGEQATVRDFVDHMSTVFTEIRFKPILELRSADSLPVPYVCALTALSWALFYDDTAQEQTLALFESLTHTELIQLHNDVIDKGSKASYRQQNVMAVAEKILAIAEKALSSLDNDPSLMLAPFMDLAYNKTTCAEWIHNHFNALDDSNVSTLINNFDPLHKPLVFLKPQIDEHCE